MAGSHEVRGSIPLCSTIYSKGSAFKRALFCVVPHSFGAILAALRRGIDDGNGANPTKEDRHFVDVAIAFLVASFCTYPFAMLM